MDLYYGIELCYSTVGLIKRTVLLLTYVSPKCSSIYYINEQDVVGVLSGL